MRSLQPERFLLHLVILLQQFQQLLLIAEQLDLHILELIHRFL
jgi:hypothetical protein